MFSPIDPPNVGYPQQRLSIDGFGIGPTYSVPFPGAGAIARGLGVQPHRGFGAGGQGDVIHPARSRLQALIMGLPDPVNAQQLPLETSHPAVPHFNMIHAAQQLAQLLAQQQHAGLRRYNGRH